MAEIADKSEVTLTSEVTKKVPTILSKKKVMLKFDRLNVSQDATKTKASLQNSPKPSMPNAPNIVDKSNGSKTTQNCPLNANANPAKREKVLIIPRNKISLVVGEKSADSKDRINLSPMRRIMALVESFAANIDFFNSSLAQREMESTGKCVVCFDDVNDANSLQISIDESSFTEFGIILKLILNLSKCELVSNLCCTTCSSMVMHTFNDWLDINVRALLKDDYKPYKNRICEFCRFPLLSLDSFTDHLLKHIVMDKPLKSRILIEISAKDLEHLDISSINPLPPQPINSNISLTHPSSNYSSKLHHTKTTPNILNKSRNMLNKSRIILNKSRNILNNSKNIVNKSKTIVFLPKPNRTVKVNKAFLRSNNLKDNFKNVNINTKDAIGTKKTKFDNNSYDNFKILLPLPKLVKMKSPPKNSTLKKLDLIANVDDVMIIDEPNVRDLPQTPDNSDKVHKIEVPSLCAPFIEDDEPSHTNVSLRSKAVISNSVGIISTKNTTNIINTKEIKESSSDKMDVDECGVKQTIDGSPKVNSDKRSRKEIKVSNQKTKSPVNIPIPRVNSDVSSNKKMERSDVRSDKSGEIEYLEISDQNKKIPETIIITEAIPRTSVHVTSNEDEDLAYPENELIIDECPKVNSDNRSGKEFENGEIEYLGISDQNRKSPETIIINDESPR